jgi:hypothetical protein
MALPRRAWVPTTMSTVPSARPFLACFEIRADEAGGLGDRHGQPLKRSAKVL